MKLEEAFPLLFNSQGLSVHHGNNCTGSDSAKGLREITFQERCALRAFRAPESLRPFSLLGGRLLSCRSAAFFRDVNSL